MKFTEAIDKDLEIFINLEEFGERHDINGEIVSSIITESTREHAGEDFDGLHGEYWTIYLKSSEISRKPSQGESIRVDNRRFSVDVCSDQRGILKIEISAYRGRGI